MTRRRTQRAVRRRERERQRRDRGSISALVVCVFVVFVACAGLVLDGGRFVAARSQAASVASQAARDGVQAVHRLREGLLVVDVPKARQRAGDYLSSVGATGDVSADESSVTVTVSVTVTPMLLGLFGIGSRTVHVSRTATPFDH